MNLNLETLYQKETIKINMGVLGDAIRELRNNIEFIYEECGGKGIVEELKDAIKAMKGE